MMSRMPNAVTVDDYEVRLPDGIELVSWSLQAQPCDDGEPFVVVSMAVRRVADGMYGASVWRRGNSQDRGDALLSMFAELTDTPLGGWCPLVHGTSGVQVGEHWEYLIPDFVHKRGFGIVTHIDDDKSTVTMGSEYTTETFTVSPKRLILKR